MTLRPRTSGRRFPPSRHHEAHEGHEGRRRGLRGCGTIDDTPRHRGNEETKPKTTQCLSASVPQCVVFFVTGESASSLAPTSALLAPSASSLAPARVASGTNSPRASHQLLRATAGAACAVSRGQVVLTKRAAGAALSGASYSSAGRWLRGLLQRGNQRFQNLCVAIVVGMPGLGVILL